VNAQPVEFPARDRPDLSLRGFLLDGSGGAGAPCVVSHPHPLAGGDMEHPVVVALWRAAAEAGLRALRYDFRKIAHHAELATGDLAGAIDFLGGGPALAVGYSYGARTTLQGILDGLPITRAALVALPTRTPGNRAAMSNLMLGRRIRSEEWRPYPDAERAAEAAAPVLVLAGDRDPLVDLDAYRAHGVAIDVIPGLNHFFSRRLGNQPPEPSDLADLAARTLRFLRDA
jgi:alpha/beta superfamily hydrolase